MYGKKGSTTVYICIIAMSVILIAAIFADVAKYYSTLTYFQKICDKCSESLLTVYSSRLKEQFGIYALSQHNYDKLDKEFIKLLNSNVSEYINYFDSEIKNKTKYNPIFDNQKALKIKISDVKITPVYNIREQGVFEYQIDDYMKMRLPCGLLEDTAKHMNMLSSFARFSSLFSKKVEIEDFLYNISKYTTELAKITQTEQSDVLSINSFKFDSALKYLTDEFLNEYTDVQKLISLCNTIIFDKVTPCTYLHEQALQIIDKIDNSISNVRNMSDQIQASITKEQYDSENSEINELNTAIKEDVQCYENIINNVMFGTVKNRLLNNLDALNKVQNNLFELISILESNNIISEKISNNEKIQQIKKDVQQLLNSYNIIEQGMLDMKADKILQNNKQQTDDAKKLIEEAGIDASWFLKEIKKENKDIKRDSKSFFETIGVLNTDAFLPFMYDFDIEDISMDISNEKKEKSKFAATEIFNKASRIFKNNTTDLLYKNFVLGEYILGTFKNAATSKYTKEHEEYDWNSVKKELRITSYKNQTEKIISAMPTDESSLIYCASEIVLIRFMLNTLQIYSQPQKRDIAYAAASGLTGWWSMGAAVPLAATLIICSWGLSEAINDIMNLLDGKYIPLLKNDEDWSIYPLKELSKSMRHENVIKNEIKIRFNYRDYLRFLLILLNYDYKKNRVLDMVEKDINTTEKEFDVDKCYTGIRIHIEAESQGIFITAHLLKKIIPDIQYPFYMRYENEIRYK